MSAPEGRESYAKSRQSGCGRRLRVIHRSRANAVGDIPVQGWRKRNLVIGELQTVIVHQRCCA